MDAKFAAELIELCHRSDEYLEKVQHERDARARELFEREDLRIARKRIDISKLHPWNTGAFQHEFDDSSHAGAWIAIGTAGALLIAAWVLLNGKHPS
ncbi:hypothetical protein [Terracidiphilus sp.]|uniref:hypothetical protein n=1 Tax=Terracidiphilus sp. TaxID=1964191 RepID=UPI003C18BA74